MLAVTAAIPIAGPPIAAVIGGLAAVTDALGLQGGRDETPWGNPPWAGYDGLNDFTWQEQNAFNPATGRFENPDGSWPFVFPPGTHIGGIQFGGKECRPEKGGPLAPYMNAAGVIVDPAMRQHWAIMHLQAIAAKRVNWDLAKVEDDRITIKPEFASDPATVAATSATSALSIFQKAAAVLSPLPLVITAEGVPLEPESVTAPPPAAPEPVTEEPAPYWEGMNQQIY
jgi:hypothetical protein